MDLSVELKHGEKDDFQISKNYFVEQKFKKSIEILYTLPSYNPEIIFWRALNYIKLEDFNALNNIMKLGTFPIHSVEYKFLKGILLFFNGEHEESVFLLESIKLQINRLVKIDTILNFEYFLYLGMGYQSMNLFSDAIEYYKIYITYNMNSEATLTNLFQCYIRVHDYDKAKYTFLLVKERFEEIDEEYFQEQLRFIS